METNYVDLSLDVCLNASPMLLDHLDDKQRLNSWSICRHNWIYRFYPIKKLTAAFHFNIEVDILSILDLSIYMAVVKQIASIKISETVRVNMFLKTHLSRQTLVKTTSCWKSHYVKLIRIKRLPGLFSFRHSRRLH